MDRISENKIKFVLRSIDKIKEKEDKFKTEINKEKDYLKYLIAHHDFEKSLKELDYKSAKEIVKKMFYILDYKEYEKLQDGVLKEIKLRDYPILDSAYHFPVLNEIKFLSKDNIKILDEYLSNSRVNMLQDASIYRKLEDIVYNTELETIKFLLDKNIIEEMYSINCPYCSNEVESLYKEEYKELKENIDKGEIWEDCCDECNQEISIENLEELKKCVDVTCYKIIAEPINTELDEI